MTSYILWRWGSVTCGPYPKLDLSATDYTCSPISCGFNNNIPSGLPQPLSSQMARSFATCQVLYNHRSTLLLISIREYHCFTHNGMEVLVHYTLQTSEHIIASQHFCWHREAITHNTYSSDILASHRQNTPLQTQSNTIASYDARLNKGVLCTAKKPFFRGGGYKLCPQSVSNQYQRIGRSRKVVQKKVTFLPDSTVHNTPFLNIVPCNTDDDKHRSTLFMQQQLHEENIVAPSVARTTHTCAALFSA